MHTSCSEPQVGRDPWALCVPGAVVCDALDAFPCSEYRSRKVTLDFVSVVGFGSLDTCSQVSSNCGITGTELSIPGFQQRSDPSFHQGFWLTSSAYACVRTAEVNSSRTTPPSWAAASPKIFLKHRGCVTGPHGDGLLSQLAQLLLCPPYYYHYYYCCCYYYTLFCHTAASSCCLCWHKHQILHLFDNSKVFFSFLPFLLLHFHFSGMSLEMVCITNQSVNVLMYFMLHQTWKKLHFFDTLFLISETQQFDFRICAFSLSFICWLLTSQGRLIGCQQEVNKTPSV